MQRNVIRYSDEFLGFMVTFRVGLGLGSGVMIGLGSGVRVGFRVRVRIRVSIGFRATRVAQSVARLSSLSFTASDRGSTPAAGCAIYESQEMGYLFNALPLSPSSIIWYWLHLKLGK